VNIICEESDVVVACRRGDLLTVRNLFLQKKAAANDMTMTNGDRTLLYVRPPTLYTIVFLTEIIVRSPEWIG
jgi:hypothetical protein